MQKRHQVFISSTYTDLKEERAAVTQTLMQMDCIPAGMELFPATDEDQLTFIKKVIDDSDYYLLIIGGRYGSVTEEGISYTEKEFQYAVEKSIPVVALIHGSPGSLPVDRSEISEVMIQRLESFKAQVGTGRLIRYWNHASDLPGLVAISMVQTMSRFPRAGWIRGTNAVSEDLLIEINDLRKENIRLKESVEQKPRVLEELVPADLSATVKLGGTIISGNDVEEWSVVVTWEKVFFFVSPYVKVGVTQDMAKTHLKSALVEHGKIQGYRATLNDQQFQTIAIQMEALGLVTIEADPLSTWRLTSSGEKLMYKLRVVQAAAT